MKAAMGALCFALWVLQPFGVLIKRYSLSPVNDDEEWAYAKVVKGSWVVTS